MINKGIKLGAFRFFTPVTGGGQRTGDWVVFSIHWKRSITWRFALYFSPSKFRLYYQTQKNMWK